MPIWMHDRGKMRTKRLRAPSQRRLRDVQWKVEGGRAVCMGYYQEGVPEVLREGAVLILVDNRRTLSMNTPDTKIDSILIIRRAVCLLDLTKPNVPVILWLASLGLYEYRPGLMNVSIFDNEAEDLMLFVI